MTGRVRVTDVATGVEIWEGQSDEIENDKTKGIALTRIVVKTASDGVTRMEGPWKAERLS